MLLLKLVVINGVMLFKLSLRSGAFCLLSVLSLPLEAHRM